jgi:hypothetical protein
LKGGSTIRKGGKTFIVIGNYSNLGTLINKRYVLLTRRNRNLLNENSTHKV